MASWHSSRTSRSSPVVVISDMRNLPFTTQAAPTYHDWQGLSTARTGQGRPEAWGTVHSGRGYHETDCTGVAGRCRRGRGRVPGRGVVPARAAPAGKRQGEGGDRPPGVVLLPGRRQESAPRGGQHRGADRQGAGEGEGAPPEPAPGRAGRLRLGLPD